MLFKEHSELLKNLDIDINTADQILELYRKGMRMSQIASELKIPKYIVFIVIKKAVLYDYYNGMSIIELKKKYSHAYSTLYQNFIQGGIKYKLWRQIYRRGNVRLIHIPSRLIPEDFVPFKAQWTKINENTFEVVLHKIQDTWNFDVDTSYCVNVGTSNNFRVIFLYVPTLVGRDKKERRFVEIDFPKFIIEFR
ncbi:MAG: hypothetical protein QXL15_04925 [Candidatus Korarchaeota archaeon]